MHETKPPKEIAHSDAAAFSDDKAGAPPNRAPRIVFLNRFFSPDESATAQMLTDLAVHLSERGRSVSVVTSRRCGSAPGSLPATARYEGIQVSRVWSTSLRRSSVLSRLLDYASFYPSAFLALLRMLRRGDILVAKTDPPLISVAAALVCKLRGADLVNWLQDLYPEVGAQLGVPLLSGPVGRCLISLRNFALRSAVANVAIGDLMAARITSQGIRRGKVAIIPNWSDEQAIVPVATSSSEFRRSLGLPDSAFVLAYSGNLGRAHEANTLIEAATMLEARKDIYFLFIGGGAENERLKALVSARGLTNFVFRPHQPREHLGDTLAAADVHWLSLRPELEGLIVPSKFYGILAAGRPVISVSDTGGELARLVTEHRCGLAVQPGDVEGLVGVISRLAADRDLREQMGERARAISDGKFSKKSALERWSRLLLHLSAQRHHRATMADPVLDVGR